MCTLLTGGSSIVKQRIRRLRDCSDLRLEPTRFATAWCVHSLVNSWPLVEENAAKRNSPFCSRTQIATALLIQPLEVACASLECRTLMGPKKPQYLWVGEPQNQDPPRLFLLLQISVCSRRKEALT
jgi:hypothetical protein